MIRLDPTALDGRTAGYLTRWTEELLQETDFGARVELAKKRFGSRNRKGSRTFDRIKEALREMSNEQYRCVYCEDNYADEVEHMRPKDIYPEQCFAWDNYVYACGPCNGPKNNHFAVLDAAGVVHDVTPPRKQPSQPAPIRTPPVAGTPLLIDPRIEDPMHLLALDFQTGALAPMPGLSEEDEERARWTRDTLGLNKRRLPKARMKALQAYRSMLGDYADAVEAPDPTEAARLETVIRGFDHPTVLREMWRQRSHEPTLDALFARVPEVGGW